MSLRAVIALTLFLFLFALPNTMLSSTIGLKDDTNTNKDPSNSSPSPRPSYEPFNGSISIESDPEFTSENGVSSGTGTKSDPYIIENLLFEVGTVPAIKIANTKAHLIIRNITVTGGRGNDLSAISLNGCKNIIIFGIEVSDGGTGIDIRRTSNIVVEKCRFLTCNTGVVADDVTDLGFFNSTMVGCKTTGSRLLGPSFNVNVLNNQAVSNDKDGMVFEGVFISLNVTGNNASMNGNYGIRCIDVDGNDIQLSKNTLSSNLGFGCWLNYCQTLWFHNNTITENPSGGILGEGLFGRSVNITGNLLLNNGIYGMELQGVQLINVLENRVSGHDHIGVYLGSGSRDNYVVGNDISGNGNTGLILGEGADRNRVLGNNISQNHIGCYVQPSSDILFEGNIFEGNIEYDCILDGITSSSMIKNDLRTINTGLVVGGSDGLDVVSNRFLGSGTVLWLDDCSNISVIDNAFYSTIIHLDQYSEVSWNLPERRDGENMIGGHFRFGNYWSDYDGEDINGDGIGDTKLPHGPGDMGPLVMNYPLPDTEPPTIIMTNFDVPVTGQVWTGRFKVHDNRSMFGVKVPSASCFQYDLKGNIIDEWTGKDVGFDDEGRFSIKLDVQPSAVDLSVNISVMDFSGNIANSSSHLYVEDPIPPEVLVMDYPSEINAGDELVLTMDLYDNVGIGSVEAIFDLGKTIAPLNASGVPLNELATKWSVSIDVPEEALEASIEVTVSDISGNKKVIQIIEIYVKDSLPPFLQDRTIGRPRTGDPFDMTFMVKDNHAISSMVLLTSQDGIDGAPIWGEGPLSGLSWLVQVPIKTMTRELTFTLKAEDRSGNEQVLRGSYLVIDTIGPFIKRIDTNEPETGEPFELRLIISDNWGTFHGELEWWFDKGQVYEMELPSERTIVPQVPLSAEELHYIVHIEDENANAAEFEQVLMVRDIIPPVLSVVFSGPRTSSQWQVYLNSSDNRGIGQIWFNRSFDDGPVVADDRTGGQKKVTITIDVPEDALRVSLDCSAKDVTGLITTFRRTIDIADGTPPVIINHTLRKIIGGYHEFSITARDNRELYKAWLNLGDGEGKEKMVLMKDMGDGMYVHRLASKRLEGYRNYSIIIEDGSGLTASTGSMDLKVQGQGRGQIWAIVIFIILLVAIFMILLLLMLSRGRLHGTGRTNGQSPLWLSRGTGDMTGPREVMLPMDAMEE